MKNLGDKAIYQVYLRSFADSNGDGIGDIHGVIKKLDYIASLWVDYIWLSPFNSSPQADNGYDVKNYYEVEPMFGTMEDLETLISLAKAKGLGIMMDMVINHTSDEHEWFQKALAGDEYYQDFYFFKDNVDGNPPTNWVSKFGGSTWEYVEHLDKWYLHLFDVKQADLNWENPHLREELVKIMQFWLDKGITGFRFDVFNLISKPEKFEDDHEGDGRRFYTDGPKVHEFVHFLNQASFGQREDVLTVGEMSSTNIEDSILYTVPSREELDLVFMFYHLKVDYKQNAKWTVMKPDLALLKEIMNEWQVRLQEGGGQMSLFWSNHDQPRIVSRMGHEGEYWAESAKMLALLMYCMRGTPFIYQGEEIGMHSANFTDVAQYKDVESLNYAEILRENGVEEDEIIRILQKKSRDNARVPMQWDDSADRGFGSKAWIDFASSKAENVKAQEADEDSVLAFYRDLLKLRKEERILQEGDYLPVPTEEEIFAYYRVLGEEKILVLCNMVEEEKTIGLDELILEENLTAREKEERFTDANLLLHNISSDITDITNKTVNQITLRPFEAMLIKV